MYSDQVRHHISEGSRQYASREYEQAATHYADACAAFSDEHGHDDADLLLLYGKALFQNGVARSGVLGGVSEQPKADDKDDGEFQFAEGMAEGEAGEASGAEPESENERAQENESGQESERENESESEHGNESESENAPSESDFEAAWEILDLARALFEDKVSESEFEAKALTTPYLVSDEAAPTSKYVEHLQKLSEAYDLLGEVSLEAENFAQAASDLQSCLELRQKLYDGDSSSLVSESHYKLSLALEFCVDDPDSRKKAAEQMKAAIAVVKTRAAAETDELKARDARDLIKDLDERYKELSSDPQMDLQSQQMDIIKGLLGEAVAGAAGAKRDLPVNDLSSMVKKRKPNKK